MEKQKHVDFSLVLACYNETPVFDGSIKQILSTLNLSRLSYEIIFVDDHSSDTTGSKIRQICQNYPQCKSIFHTTNMGRGKTVSDGFRQAKGTVVGYVDFDLEVPPVYIPAMVQMILDRRADCVIGKRVYRSSIASFAREVYSIGYQKFSDILVGTGGLDTESGYKFFRRTKVLPLLSKTKHPHWFWDTEIMVYARLAHVVIYEMPVIFVRRFDKTSSVKVVRDILDYIVSLYRFRIRLNLEKKI